MEFAYITDRGKHRKKNEDSVIVVENQNHDIFMMCFDGMGGHNLGDLATSLAQEYLINEFNKKKSFWFSLDMYFWLRSTIKKTNDYLFKYTNSVPTSKGMGTTFTSFLIHKNDVLMSYVGDTRAYIIKDKIMTQVSKDETYVEYLYSQGRITKEEMKTHKLKHVITNALGCYQRVEINTEFIKKDYDYLLLCTDGLYNLVSEEDIVNIIYENQDINISIKKLVDLANFNGGLDNIAIALLKR